MFQNQTFTTVLSLAGPNCAAFLQNIITNDVNLLEKQPALYACLLSPQGKFLHDFVLLRQNETYLLLTEQTRADELLKKLLAYRLRQKIEMKLETSLHVGFSFHAPSAPSILSFPDPRHPALGLIGLSTQPFPSDAQAFYVWNEKRIRLSVANGALDADIGLSTLEELNITKFNGVSFTKGCYVGQELTARLHNRGLGKKHLVPVLFEQSAPPAGRADILSGDVVVGQLRSSCGALGLALLKDNSVFLPLQCNGQALKVLT